MRVFDIKRFAINDGPGIRITIFMKGCPLHCVWCHNPEGISPQPVKFYTRTKCIGCRSCVKVCPRQALTLTSEGIVTDMPRCKLCGACGDACPTLSMEMSGKEYTTDELLAEIRKEIPVIDSSGGGVTLCGGEPLMHPEPLIELLQQIGELHIHRAVDTTLYASAEVVEQVMPHTDLFLVDLKHMDSSRHLQYCGVPNELILSNIRRIAEAGKPFFVRIPLIEGINADNDNLQQSASFLASLPWQQRRVNLLPYHDIGRGKHIKMGSTYNPQQIAMSKPSDFLLQHALAIFASYGIQATIGG